MEAWVAKGLGDYPYIGTREQYDKLPEIGKQEIATRFPEHAEWLTADESKLPAELRLRMQRKELLFTDIDALEAAGYPAAVAFLHKARQAAMLATWEANVKAGQEEMALHAAAREQELEQLRIASLNHSNQQARQQYIRQLHSGSGIEQPSGPVTIAG
jgi:hypothetical protein